MAERKKIDRIKDLIVVKETLPAAPQSGQELVVFSEEDFSAYEMSHKFDPGNRPPEQDILLKQAGEDVGSRSNIIAVTGRAKSRKSAIVSAMLSSMLSPNEETILGFTSHLKDDDEIVHVDTEQSKYDYWIGLDRTIRRAGTAARINRIHSIYARDAEIDFLIQMTEYLLRKHKPRVLIIDGVADYILDINNHEGVSKLGRRIMKWSTDYDCLIIVVIHTTKTTGYMTGALGTWFEKKAETVVKCDKPEDQEDITNVTCQYARSKPFKPFTIEWSHKTDRYEVVDESRIIQPQGPKNNKLPGSYNDEVHDQILSRVFLVSKSMSEEQLVSSIGTHATEVTGHNIGKRDAEKWRLYYRNKTKILQDPDKNWSRIFPISNKSEDIRAERPSSATEDLPF